MISLRWIERHQLNNRLQGALASFFKIPRFLKTSEQNCSCLSWDFLKVRQTDALRQFNFISACWNWYGIKKMPACGWVSAEWREGRRLPRPVLWREQFSIPDRGLALYPQNMGKLLRRSLPHPHIHSTPLYTLTLPKSVTFLRCSQDAQKQFH